jgi:acetyltransferase-like isoleucine patch superfamily enzyme
MTAARTLVDLGRRFSRSDRAGKHWVLMEFRARAFSRWIAPSFAEFGQRAQIWPPCIVFGASSISIGSFAWPGPGTRLNAEDGGLIEIQAGAQMMGDGAISARVSVTIEEYALLARGVTIVDHQHAADGLETPIVLQGANRMAPVRICQGAWLGTNAIVMPGVTIGRNATVGAGAVVTHDVDAGAIVAGVPAQRIDRA